MNRLLFFVVAIVVVVTGCSKKKSTIAARSVQQNNTLDSVVAMRALINEVPWQTDSVYAYRIVYGGNTPMYDLYISGWARMNDTPSTISFTIVNYTGPKSYAINPPQVSATYYRGNERYYATLGSINITSDSPNVVTGTFNFTSDTIIVNGGSFNVARP